MGPRYEGVGPYVVDEVVHAVTEVRRLQQQEADDEEAHLGLFALKITQRLRGRMHAGPEGKNAHRA